MVLAVIGHLNITGDIEPVIINSVFGLTISSTEERSVRPCLDCHVVAHL